MVLNSGKQKGRETKLAQGVYLVGRSKLCQIRPKNKSVSRKHCAIIVGPDSIQLRDIGSKTGTFLNGERLEHNVNASISDGDKLRIGRTRFRFQLDTVASSEMGSARPASAEILQSTPVELPRAHEQKSVASAGRARSGQPEPALAKVGAGVAAPDDVASIDQCDVAEPSDPPVDATNARVADLGMSDLAPPKPPLKEPDDVEAVRSYDSVDELPADEDVAVQEEAASDGPSVAESSEELAQPSAADILRLLEDDEAEDAAGTAFTFSPPDDDESDVNLDSDSDVDFLAPASGESVKPNQDVPSYQLRQDWDVNGVRKWVSDGSGGTATKAAPTRPQTAKPDPRPFGKPQAGKKQDPSGMPAILGAFDGDSMQMTIMVGAGLLFLAWMVWNGWRLYSFSG